METRLYDTSDEASDDGKVYKSVKGNAVKSFDNSRKGPAELPTDFSGPPTGGFEWAERIRDISEKDALQQLAEQGVLGKQQKQNGRRPQTRQRYNVSASVNNGGRNGKSGNSRRD
eukprot:CAMPEP_0197499694 /NCGR_PEP_ID=MMETSP1311-20131121/61152_1 /TAXON_ID=464262 /ORGANISM="Genus nov. species nov., Strain RCC856" /LENGTH=114 /DNA_ID=CAMNT_0043045439 /DNA_START=50 /DNA_END=394 /DNA_ORIENTATION=-